MTDLEPSPAELGDTMTITPGEWTPLDDHGAEIYLYGDQPADIAFQVAAEKPQVTFRDVDGTVAVYVGAQRVARLPAEAELAIDALVDVLEALGLRPTREGS